MGPGVRLLVAHAAGREQAHDAPAPGVEKTAAATLELAHTLHGQHDLLERVPARAAANAARVAFSRVDPAHPAGVAIAGRAQAHQRVQAAKLKRLHAVCVVLLHPRVSPGPG